MDETGAGFEIEPLHSRNSTGKPNRIGKIYTKAGETDFETGLGANTAKQLNKNMSRSSATVTITSDTDPTFLSPLSRIHVEILQPIVNRVSK